MQKNHALVKPFRSISTPFLDTPIEVNQRTLEGGWKLISEDICPEGALGHAFWTVRLIVFFFVEILQKQNAEVGSLKLAISQQMDLQEIYDFQKF